MSQESPIVAANLQDEVVRLFESERWTAKRIQQWLADRSVQMTAGSIHSWLSRERKRRSQTSAPLWSDLASRGDLSRAVSSGSREDELRRCYETAMHLAGSASTKMAQVKALELAAKTLIVERMLDE